MGSLSTLSSGSRNRKKSPGGPLLHVVNPIPAHRLTCVPVAIFLQCEPGKQAADTPASTGQGVLTPVLLILEASAPLLLSHALQFCLLGLVVGWVSVSYFLTEHLLPWNSDPLQGSIENCGSSFYRVLLPPKFLLILHF